MVDPNDPENELSGTMIRDMGFFSHEAVDIDPATGIVYLTEDDFRGAVVSDPKDEVVADQTTDQGRRGSRVSVNYYIETKNPEAAPGMEEERLMDKYGLTQPPPSAGRS